MIGRCPPPILNLNGLLKMLSLPVTVPDATINLIAGLRDEKCIYYVKTIATSNWLKKELD